MEDEKLRGEGIDGYFFRLVATFEAAAMQQMGKIASPITGDVEVNIDGARDSIDMLGMLHRKCDGNLNEDEQRLLDHVLYQLRMNYVEVSSEAASEERAGAGSGAGRETEGGEGSGDGADTEGDAGADGAHDTGREGEDR